MKVVFLLSQVVFAITMVVSAVLGFTLSSGVLLRVATSAPGVAPLPASIMEGLRAATSSKGGFPFAASGIDYLTI